MRVLRVYTERFKAKYDGGDVIGAGCLAIVAVLFVVSVVGYLMNFQNIWEYWPGLPADATIAEWLDKVPFSFILSVVGIFVPPLGVITGWIF